MNAPYENRPSKDSARFVTSAYRPLWMFSFAVMLVSLLPGCSTTGLFSKFTHHDKVPKASTSNPVVRCLCLWEPGEGTGVDNKPARGVVGQIFFFTRDSVSSVAADGDVRIFTFDDQGTEEEQSIPLHQFEFLSNSFQTYMRPTQFGPAYQLFVPYSRKGRHQAELAIRVRLAQPGGAPPVFSELTKVVLAGHERPLQKHKNKLEAEDPAHGSDGQYVPAQEAETVSPNLIEETFHKVRAEHMMSTRLSRTTAPQNDDLYANVDHAQDSELNPSPRNAQRSNRRRNESNSRGEFNVPDQSNQADDQPQKLSRIHLRKSAPQDIEPTEEGIDGELVDELQNELEQ